MTKLCIALALCSGLAACSKPAAEVFPGYAEGESVRLAAPISGTLSKLYVQRGDSVAAGAPAFVLEQESERSAREEAVARVQRAQDQLANLKLGKRPDELAALRAQLAQVQAALKLSTAEQARAEQLVAENFTSAASLDQTRAAVARDQARVNELNAQLRLAGQGSRRNEIAAAEQEVKAATARRIARVMFVGPAPARLRRAPMACKTRVKPPLIAASPAIPTVKH